MAKVTRVAPVEWLEGYVSVDSTIVVGEDGTEYRLPWRIWSRLDAGERIKFTLSTKLYHGTRRVKRIMFLP